MQRKTIARHTELGGDGITWYEVFARRDSTEPLMHIGAVEAPNVELAKARAWYVYDHCPWKEMCLVPTSAVIPVTGDGQRLKIKVV
jgi:1,2-phenylacetyl-CoA epoxidase PaaB subunit